MVNVLTQARKDVSQALKDAGLNAFDYVAESFTPPACLVVPNNPYLAKPVGDNPFNKPYSVRLQVIVIAGKGTNQVTAEQIDSLLSTAVEALDEEWEVTEVQAPQEVSLKGVTYLGSLVTLTINTNL